MNSRLKLGPLSNHDKKPTAEPFECLQEDLGTLHRENRYHLKRYLSTNQLSVPHSLSKKPFELTETTINHLSTPRIMEKLLGNSKSCKNYKEKKIDKMIQIKKANKNVLNAMNNFTLNKSLKKQQIFIQVPNEFKTLDQVPSTKRSESVELVEWFEDEIRDGCWTWPELLKKSENEQIEEIKKFQRVLNAGFVKFVELLSKHCIEQAGFLSQFIEKFGQLWQLKFNFKLNSQELQMKNLSLALDKEKQGFTALETETKNKIFGLEKLVNEKNKEIIFKDSEISRLRRLVNLVKEEKAENLMKLMKKYDGMIFRIKKQMESMVDEVYCKSAARVEHKVAGQHVLAEVHLAEKFKEENLSNECISEAFKEYSNDAENAEDKFQGLGPDYINIFSDQFTQTDLSQEDKETNIGPIYFNEESQTSFIDLNIPKIAITSLETEILDLQQSGLIPPSVEIESWSAGYFTGLDRGKTLAQNESLQAYETEETFSSQFEDLQDSDSQMEDLEKKEEKIEFKRKKLGTKFKQFNFQKREKIVMAKVSKTKKLKEYFLKMSPETVSKKTKMSKKMLMKTINNIYLSLIPKIKSDEFPKDLLEYIYSEFESKNSLEKLVRRKVMNLLCNLVKFSGILKVRNFLRFLDLSSKTSEPALSCPKDSLLVYLAGLDFIFKSKAGIMSEFSEFSESHYVPTIRVSEFFKSEFSEIFPTSRFSKIFEFIEKNSVYDKKRLNKSGVIDLESVLNFAVDQYEDHCIGIKNTGLLIMKALNCEEHPEYVRKSDLVFISGLLRPGKHFRELETSSVELFRCEEVLNGPLKGIFPEEFVAEFEGDLDLDDKKLIEIIQNDQFLDKHQIFQDFLQRRKKLGVRVLACIKKIVGIYSKGN